MCLASARERLGGGIVHCGDGSVREDTDDPGAERAEDVESGGGQQRIGLRGAVNPLRLHVRRVQCSPFLLRRRRLAPMSRACPIRVSPNK